MSCLYGPLSYPTCVVSAQDCQIRGNGVPGTDGVKAKPIASDDASKAVNGDINHVTAMNGDTPDGMNGHSEEGAAQETASAANCENGNGNSAANGAKPAEKPAENGVGAHHQLNGARAKGSSAASRASRGQNTQVFVVDGDSIIRLHQTNIVTIHASGDVTLSSGGWRTHQTLKGINMSLKNFVPGLQVVADGHVAEGAWRVTNGRDWAVPFFDGVVVAGAGPTNVASQAQTGGLPSAFDQMSINTNGHSNGVAGFSASYANGSGNANHTRGSARSSRARGGSGRYKGVSNDQAVGGGGAAGRPPLPSPPVPLVEEQTSNLEAYDDIPVDASGEDCPPPIEQFSDLSLHPLLQKNIDLANFVKPTPVQRHALPVCVGKRDLMACAQTGSGKTGAFLFPVLHQMLGEMDLEGQGQGPRQGVRAEPRCLILAPTRELATQIMREAQRFSHHTRITPVVVYGGADMRMQVQGLERGCNVLVATPGRLCDLIERGKLTVEKTKHLILDEADRMLDMGFEPQIRRIVEREGMPPTGERQTLMFSATFPKEIQQLASEFMTRYIFVADPPFAALLMIFALLAVGRVGSTTELITQTVVWAEESDKRRVLLEQLAACKGRTIIFVETKRSAESLEEFLYQSSVPATSIHGDRSQREREQALLGFRRGQPAVLVATDVAARGLDVPECMHVINFELPREINSYVHRIGRTGRMGRSGTAISLFSSANKPVARGMVTLLQEANQECPEWLLKLAAEGSSSSGRGYSRSKFGGIDFRANAQVRQYRHSASGGGQMGAPVARAMHGHNGQMAQWPQQGYMAGITHKHLYSHQMASPAGMPGLMQPDLNGGWVAGGWQQMGMGGIQQMPAAANGAYQQQMPGGSGPRPNGAGFGYAMQAQAPYGQFYPQQAQGQEQMQSAMMQQGMLWARQQPMAVPSVQEGQYAAQQHYAQQAM
ncbi:MAG: hypothetical protein SGPRY_008753 [Prymnesium sp.]